MPPRGPRHPRKNLRRQLEPAVVAADSLSTSPADLPELFLEWAPNDGPGVADPTWVSLNAYLTAGSCDRGRQVEFDQFSAGTMSFTLEAFTRLFDPENTAGTYYGKLTPMRQVRLRAKWAGTTYPVWRGFVKQWGSTVVRNKKFVTNVTCADAFLKLEQTKLRSSAFAMEVAKDNPSSWFRLNETGTTRATDSGSAGRFGSYDNCQQGATGLVAGDADRAAAFTHTSMERVSFITDLPVTAFPFTVSLFFQIGIVDSPAASDYKIMWTAYSNGLHIFMTGSTVLGGGAATPGSVGIWSVLLAEMVTSDARYDDGKPHHLVAVFTSSLTSLYIDGAFVASTAKATAFPSTAATYGMYIGNTANFDAGVYGFGATVGGTATRGTIDEVCLWTNTALNATRIAAHSAAGKTGWAGDDTGTRVGRILDLIAWPSSLRDVQTGISTLGVSTWTDGASTFSVLQGLADTEFGAFFAGKDGKLVWRSRHYPLLNTNATRSRATFGDVASTAPIKIQDDAIDIYRDSTLIRNPVLASRDNGVTARASDDNLKDFTYGDRTWSAPSAQDQNDATMADRAQWLLARFKNESMRLKAMTANLRQQPTNWSTVLDLELGDRITVKRTPLGLDNQIAVDQIIEGIAWSFTPFDLTPTFRGSPVDPNVGSYLIEDDAVYGLLDTAELAY